ncbi:uncharacterized protein [Glycine max]|uniref:uncharacterized protein isoform X1 n=1 Tax=Glycine max TaxID=3847 RepID=UPI001B354FB6|nr:uncharacterized protein LOC121174944 isoform X1 [Glycine max]
MDAIGIRLAPFPLELSPTIAFLVFCMFALSLGGDGGFNNETKPLTFGGDTAPSLFMIGDECKGDAFGISILRENGSRGEGGGGGRGVIKTTTELSQKILKGIEIVSTIFSPEMKLLSHTPCDVASRKS